MKKKRTPALIMVLSLIICLMGDNTSAVPVFDLERRTVTLNSGYEMPVAGLGTYALSDEEC